MTEGYCIDLDCGSGGLAYALARQSNLRIVALGADPDRAGEARRRFDTAGLYGERVTLLAVDDARSLPDYLGDLVVCDRSVEGAMELATRGPLAISGDWTHQYCDPANSNCSTDTLLSGRLVVHFGNDVKVPLARRERFL